ncbi:MAG: O-methyltransferase [Myxococcales bacterium]
MADNQSRAGARYTTRELLAYVEKLHAPHDASLAKAFGTPAESGIPAIQVAPSEGKLLGMLIGLAGARKVVEVGTLAGYSAIRMAQRLAPGGHLWTFESEPKHHALAQANVATAGLSDRITCLLGKALDGGLDELARREGPFDVVFIDADKGNYNRYGRWAAEHLRSGGVLLGDNAFFFGRLLEESAEAEAMRRFHEEAARAFDTVCIPTPDGLLLGLKR